MLSKSWYMEPAIDFELKKYTLLAFLQKTQAAFNKKQIEPFYLKLKELHKELIAFHEQKQQFEENLPKHIHSIDWEKQLVNYEINLQEQNSFFIEIDKIVDYSGKQIKKQIDIAENIIEEINQGLTIFPLGIQPLYKDEGYLFLMNKKIYVFQYSLNRIYKNNDDDMYYLNTSYIDEYRYSISNTLEHIKLKLHKQESKFGIPATYVVENTGADIPLWETLLPLAKNIFINYIYNK